MELTTIVEDHSLYFGDEVPKVRDIMIEAFDQILIHEDNYLMEVDYENYFTVTAGAENDAITYITSPNGSYLMHDLKEETSPDGVEVVVFFSISKIKK